MTNAVGLAGNNSSSNNASSLNQTTTSTNASPSVNNANQSSIVNNRLQFNRLATERKTVHVMNANLNKDVSKRDRQILASYNHAAAAAASGTGANSASTAAGGGGAAQCTNLKNALHHQHYLNSGQGTLDYNMLSGRSHTNAGSFLQKLSSKFTRR